MTEDQKIEVHNTIGDNHLVTTFQNHSTVIFDDRTEVICLCLLNEGRIGLVDAFKEKRIEIEVFQSLVKCGRIKPLN